MRVDLSGQRLTMPPQCACCGGLADGIYVAVASKSRGRRKVTTTTKEWHFPSCRTCLHHTEVHGRAGVAAVGLAIAALLLGSLVGRWGVAIGLAAAVAAFLSIRRSAARACRPSCAVAGSPVVFLGWVGSVQQFEVASPAYAAAFLAANERKAVNLGPEARQALLEGKVTRAMDAEADQASEQTLEDFMTEWVPRIEAQRGPAGRRAMLTRALAVVPYTAVRERLLLEASRIEVAAVLDKVDGLKTTAARRRHIEAALQDLRGDSVPDALQAQQVAWLEAALASLAREDS